ncbi:uncharacterized protein LOC143011512 [Genypterus blacodes]|uniref:uncharacterized protein LOC143011512 n=1 Tax=Genypterus blacodes TaxID=154954 RepID=UPI003F757323
MFSSMMSVCLSLCLLVAGLRLSGGAQADECPQVLEPLPTEFDTKMLGRWNFIQGYTDYPKFDTILKQTESSWISNTVAADNTTWQMSQENKINGTCVASLVIFKTEGNVFKQSIGTLSSSFVMLPSCAGCITLSINTSITDPEKMLRPFGFNMSFTETQIFARSLYLFARDTSVEAPGLESLQQQAVCSGFTQPAAFTYDPKSGFCAAGEGKKVFTQEPETNE